MTSQSPMQYGTFSLSRSVDLSRDKVYAAWTQLEHKQHWFAGPGWEEIDRSLELKVGGQEVAHGRFPDGTETIYTSTFHLIVPNERLVYAFDMHVGGVFYSVSLTGVEFHEQAGRTQLTYTEQIFLLGEADVLDSRIEGTEALMDKFTSYLANVR